MSQFIDYPNRDLLVSDLANKLAGALRDVLATQDRASLIVPGGSTPGVIFDVLCDANIDLSSSGSRRFLKNDTLRGPDGVLSCA